MPSVQGAEDPGGGKGADSFSPALSTKRAPRACLEVRLLQDGKVLLPGQGSPQLLTPSLLLLPAHLNLRIIPCCLISQRGITTRGLPLCSSPLQPVFSLPSPPAKVVTLRPSHAAQPPRRSRPCLPQAPVLPWPDTVLGLRERKRLPAAEGGADLSNQEPGKLWQRQIRRGGEGMRW